MVSFGGIGFFSEFSGITAPLKGCGCHANGGLDGPLRGGDMAGFPCSLLVCSCFLCQTDRRMTKRRASLLDEAD